jgi:hypothetical protein
MLGPFSYEKSLSGIETDIRVTSQSHDTAFSYEKSLSGIETGCGDIDNC